MAEHVHTTIVPFVRRGGERPASDVWDRRGSDAEGGAGVVATLPCQTPPPAKPPKAISLVGASGIREIMLEIGHLPAADLLQAADLWVAMALTRDTPEDAARHAFRAWVSLGRALDEVGLFETLRDATV